MKNDNSIIEILTKFKNDYIIEVIRLVNHCVFLCINLLLDSFFQSVKIFIYFMIGFFGFIYSSIYIIKIFKISSIESLDFHGNGDTHFIVIITLFLILFSMRLFENIIISLKRVY